MQASPCHCYLWLERQALFVGVQVALGRCALEPLPVLASLCGPSAEIVAMNLHPLKNLIPRQEIAAAAERVCITAVNQVTTALLSVILWVLFKC